MNSIPRTLVLLLAAATVALPADHAAAQTVVAGPIYNAASGSRYYRIEGSSYTQLRDFAISMGGNLATINDEAENTFVTTNVAQDFKPFIGLNDADTEGTFTWSDGSDSAYRKWRAGEPSNTAAKDFVRYVGATGEWEVVTLSFTPFAIVEIPASNPVRVPQERPTLQAALSTLLTSGTNRILLAPGVYTFNDVGLGNVDISGSGMGVTFIQTSTTNSAFNAFGNVALRNMTIINRTSEPSVEVFGDNIRIRGVDFTSLPGSASGVLLRLNSGNASAIVENCRFSVSQHALSVDTNSGSLSVINSIFRDLEGVYTNSTAQKLAFTNCLFTRIGPADLFAFSQDAIVTNSIFFDNSGSYGSAQITYSLTPSALPGTGNIVGNPRFTNAATNDFTLLPDSPAIDAGLITPFLSTMAEDFLDFGNMPRVADAPQTPNAAPSSPIDMGPFEYQPPAPTDTCQPDFNNDGFVDDTDFVTFAQFYDLFTCP